MLHLTEEERAVLVWELNNARGRAAVPAYAATCQRIVDKLSAPHTVPCVRYAGGIVAYAVQPPYWKE